MYEELKKAAEACKDLLPLRYMESHGSLYIRNDCGIVFDVHQNRSFPDFMAHNKAYADLALAANPSAVLALIAENERLRALPTRNALIKQRDSLIDERDQLKAENEALREVLAKEIYGRWAGEQGFVPWVDRGNSLKQDEARRLARAAMEKDPGQ